jgi:hypothetical protein
MFFSRVTKYVCSRDFNGLLVVISGGSWKGWDVYPEERVRIVEENGVFSATNGWRSGLEDGKGGGYEFNATRTFFSIVSSAESAVFLNPRGRRSGRSFVVKFNMRTRVYF